MTGLAYNDDEEILSVTLPLSNQVQYTYNAANDTDLDTLRHAILEAEDHDELVDFIVLNPVDYHDIELIKDAASNIGQYVVGDPVSGQPMDIRTLWGRRVIVTNSMTSGSFLVGNSDAARIFDRQEAVVDISTEQDGAPLSTQVHRRRLAFSNFAQFVDRWDPDVQIHDDELDGRFHANSEITVLYDRKVRPTFHGKVTTTSRRINTANSKGRSRRKEIFRGGLETGVRRISKPGLRVYTSAKEIPSVRNGFGVSVLSTPLGLMGNREARQRNVGGELLCEVW